MKCNMIFKQLLHSFLNKHQITKDKYNQNKDNIDLYIICSNPVLWCQHFLVEPRNPKKKWQFWDYQIDSIQHEGHTIHKCGAEVGKTREIIAYGLWQCFTTNYGTALITAPLNVFIDEIYSSMMMQIYNNKHLSKGISTKKAPYKKILFPNGFQLDFRPAGYNGTQLRGVHATSFAIIDEAARIVNKECWNEFWRALEPSCVVKLYSVPDGSRISEFYKLTSSLETSKDSLLAAKQDNIVDETPEIDFRLFKWSKSQMPPPFWTEERKRFYIKLFGSELASGYRRNIHGEDGDPEDAIFPWDMWSRLLGNIPEYRCLKITLDAKRSKVSAILFRYDDDKQVLLSHREYKESEFNLQNVIKKSFVPVPGLKIAGCDLGHSSDPSEFIISSIRNKHIVVARLHMMGITYDMQVEAIKTLDELYTSKGGDCMWGIDYGNAGASVIHMLQAKGEKWRTKVMGYKFNENLQVKDDKGRILYDAKIGKPVTRQTKELATDELIRLMQNQGAQYPYDEDMIMQFSNHSGHKTDRGMSYNKGNDHIIDACRCGILRYFYQPNLSMLGKV